jgi:DNA-binding MarR family transcriptional regulator
MLGSDASALHLLPSAEGWAERVARPFGQKKPRLDTQCCNTYIPSMPASLRDDIRQKKPFTSLHHEATLNVVRTSAMLGDALEDLLKPHGVSATQYNVLRILRGAEPTGLCRNELRDRMLTRMPDMTRLLDRMEEAGLVARTRHEGDRRLVLTRITKQGRKVVDALDAPVHELHQSTLGHLSPTQLRTLIDLLTLARS